METPIENSELPRERLGRLGSSALSSVELLAVILGVGARGVGVMALAGKVLKQVGGTGALANASPLEFSSIPGIGAARAMRICAAIELGRRTVEAQASRDGPVCSAEDVYGLLRIVMGGLMQEVFMLLILDARNHVIERVEIARGSLTEVDVHPREIFRPVIRSGGAAVVVAHNHPSGDPEPSAEDIELTRRIMAGGDILGIPVLDHLVVTQHGFSSIAEKLSP